MTAVRAIAPELALPLIRDRVQRFTRELSDAPAGLSVTGYRIRALAGMVEDLVDVVDQLSGGPAPAAAPGKPAELVAAAFTAWIAHLRRALPVALGHEVRGNGVEERRANQRAAASMLLEQLPGVLDRLETAEQRLAAAQARLRAAL